MGIFWKIEEICRRIEALKTRASFFPKEKEYCEKTIKRLKKELEELHKKLKGD